MITVMIPIILITLLLLCLIRIYIHYIKTQRKIGTVEIIQVGQVYAVRVFGYAAHCNCSPVRLKPSEKSHTPEWHFVDNYGNMAYSPANGALTKSAQFDTFLEANNAAEKARYFVAKDEARAKIDEFEKLIEKRYSEILSEAEKWFESLERNGSNL